MHLAVRTFPFFSPQPVGGALILPTVRHLAAGSLFPPTLQHIFRPLFPPFRFDFFSPLFPPSPALLPSLCERPMLSFFHKGLRSGFILPNVIEEILNFLEALTRCWAPPSSSFLLPGKACFCFHKSDLPKISIICLQPPKTQKWYDTANGFDRPASYIYFNHILFISDSGVRGDIFLFPKDSFPFFRRLPF